MENHVWSLYWWNSLDETMIKILQTFYGGWGLWTSRFTHNVGTMFPMFKCLQGRRYRLLQFFAFCFWKITFYFCIKSEKGYSFFCSVNLSRGFCWMISFKSSPLFNLRCRWNLMSITNKAGCLYKWLENDLAFRSKVIYYDEFYLVFKIPCTLKWVRNLRMVISELCFWGRLMTF